MFINIRYLIIHIYFTLAAAIIILCGFNLQLYSQPIKFKHLTVENGLSNNYVNAVIQDQYGFMWFGTNDGLNRYDGYNFKIFRNDPDDSNSISDNGIQSLLEDRNGEIWIGTESGKLDKYNPRTEEFSHIEFQSNINVNNGIESIYDDKIGNIWVGTHLEGLYRLNLKNNIIDNWIADPNNSKSLSHNYVLSILEDNSGNIIVGTYNGLNILDPDKTKLGFNIFYYEKNNKNSLSDNLIWALSKSSIDSNIIWIGTSNGVEEYNAANSTFRRIKIDNTANLQFGESCGYAIDEINASEKIMW